MRRLLAGRDFRAYFVHRQSTEAASTIEDVAIGWQVFGLRHQPFDLGLVGLAFFVPFLVLALPAGFIADRFDRKRVCLIFTICELAAMLGFAALAASHSRSLALYLAATSAVGAAHALKSPAERTLLAQIVAADAYVAATSSTWSISQLISIAGPAIGGALLLLGAPVAFGAAAAGFAIGIAALAFLRPLPPTTCEAVRWQDAALGVRYILTHKIVLGAITLDLFAVLFGGATALLPVFASTILRIGPVGLGLLNAAPAFGGALVAAAIARKPLERGIGRLLLTTVAGFGLATIVFGLSTNVWLSLAALACVGGFDMVSMVIRSTLVQLATPNEMRGRVGAVENLFIASSNQLGAFESGTLAAFVGTQASVVAGGVGTLIVIALCAFVSPELRRFDRVEAGDQAQAG